MSRYLLYEEIAGEEEVEQQKRIKVLAEGFKFRNGKIAFSFNLPVPSVFVFDNLDQFSSVYCSDKVKLHTIPDK